MQIARARRSGPARPGRLDQPFSCISQCDRNSDVLFMLMAR
jgi:hypothetical protein